jgi:hypothetical protein
MKKAVFLLLVVFLIIPASSFAQAPAAPRTNVCQVVALEGDVVIEGASGAPRPAVKGEYLREGDTIKTGSGAFVILSYDPSGRNIVQVGERSTVKIMSIRPTDLALKTGQLMAKLKALDKGETFEISTPVCVAAVRGTVYSVLHAMALGSTVRSFERNIDVFNVEPQGNLGKDNVLLRQGHQVFVDLDGKFGKISRLGDSDYSQRETFDRRAREANIRGVNQQNPPPKDASFDEPKGGEPAGGVNMNNAFDNMDRRAGGIQTTEVNQQITDNTKDLQDHWKDKDRHSSYP